MRRSQTKLDELFHNKAKAMGRDLTLLEQDLLRIIRELSHQIRQLKKGKKDAAL